MARSLFDDGVEPLELVQARALLSAAGLALIPAAWKRPERGAALTAVALGLSIALVNAVYYVAIERLAVAVALVLQYTGPALLVGWVAVTTRKAPSKEIVLALVAAFVGVMFVSELLTEDLGDLDAIGIACGAAAAVFFATYTLLSERAGAAYGVLGALFRGFLAASAMWIVFQIPRGWPSALTTPEHLPRVLFIGLAGTLAPFLLYLWGVRRVNPERAIIAATLEPPVAGVIAWIWLDQVLSPLQIVGGALTLAAVALLQVRKADPAPPPLPD
jgi:drug/metabolite transporter (DMT)-like permease